MAKAQECFITGTAAEVTPVREIGQYTFTPGEVCRTLMADYDAACGKMIAKDTAA
jgi:branched-chain amino acid aminotransferase